jgi:hypothetical protein
LVPSNPALGPPGSRLPGLSWAKPAAGIGIPRIAFHEPALGIPALLFLQKSTGINFSIVVLTPHRETPFSE